MTTDFALVYIARKMRDNGTGDNYAIAFRELQLKGKEIITLDAPGQFYYLVGGFSSEIKINSELGEYDQSSDSINELKHEHTGKITIENKSSEYLRVQFVLAIPTH